MPAFPKVLEAADEAYRDRKEELLTSTAQITEYLQQQAEARASNDPLTREIFAEAYRTLAGTFDPGHGGFGRAPKFPSPMTYEFLLRHWRATGDSEPLRMVELTLQKMAAGGIYDQIGGGFHRYATDQLWLVPHFEKMLYDNGQLVQLYLHAWQATHDDRYRRVVEKTLAYVEREMLGPKGGFYSAQDADSEGEEGKFFVWTPAELHEALGADLTRVVRAYYSVTEAGNFEGRSILWRPRPDEAVAAELGVSVEALRTRIDAARAKLLEARSRRVSPGRDDKVLTSWNALMLRAFAEAGAALDNAHYVDVARRNAAFLLSSLISDGRLLRTWKDGRAKLNAYLEDYGYLIDALLTLYEATFEPRWLDEANRLADGVVDLFWDEAQGVFFDTGRDHEQLLVRPRDIFDNATPSGGSAAALALLRLAVFSGNIEQQRYAIASLRSVRDFLARMPSGFANWLCALDFYLSTPKEIAVIGPRDDAATRALLNVVFGAYRPNKVVAGAETPPEKANTPLLEGREMIGGHTTAYVCESYACQMPVTKPDALAVQLNA